MVKTTKMKQSTMNMMVAVQPESSPKSKVVEVAATATAESVN